MLLAALFALTLSPGAGQDKTAVDEWTHRHREAVELYRGGDTPGALTLLGTMTAQAQKKAIETMGAWPHTAVRALGALHFEAALTALRGQARDDHETAEHHIELARALFDLPQTTGKFEDRSALRWITAIALVQMAHAELIDAYRLLSPHCDDDRAEAMLLVACGTIAETYASLSGPELARVGLPTINARTLLQAPALGSSAREFSQARNLRASWLASARTHFERTLARDNSDPEGQLRLAHVLLQQKQHDQSAALLEKLVARTGLDPRSQYLAHLFLGRVRLRQGQVDAAAQAFRGLKPFQSALLAQAQVAQQRGDAREAAVLVDRASRLQHDDPWWGYRFGQYWIYGALLEQLRAEARR